MYNKTLVQIRYFTISQEAKIWGTILQKYFLRLLQKIMHNEFTINCKNSWSLVTVKINLAKKVDETAGYI